MKEAVPLDKAPARIRAISQFIYSHSHAAVKGKTYTECRKSDTECLYDSGKHLIKLII